MGAVVERNVCAMPKRKNSPPPPSSASIANSQEHRDARATLANGLSFLSERGSRLGLSIERAEALVMKRADALMTRLTRTREARVRTVEAMRDGQARRRYLGEQRAADRAIQRFWRKFFARQRPETRHRVQRSKRMAKLAVPGGSTRLAAYPGPIIDRLGRRSVFLAARYYGAKRAKVGVARRLVAYIVRPVALERDADGRATILSNVGESVAEQMTGFDLIESLARASRGNAKVVFSMLVTLPHDVTPEARREILTRFCLEAFELHDLPYVATIQTPPPEGDQRNNHGHIIFALRPMQRVGDHEWDVAPRLATEHDGEARFTYYRRLFAETMTEVVQAHGRNRIYTHLSNAERGLPALPLKTLGPALSKAVRDGQIAGANEQNRLRVERNLAAMAADRDRRLADRKAARVLLADQLQAARMPPRPALPPFGAVHERVATSPLPMPKRPGNDQVPQPRGLPVMSSRRLEAIIGRIMPLPASLSRVELTIVRGVDVPLLAPALSPMPLRIPAPVPLAIVEPHADRVEAPSRPPTSMRGGPETVQADLFRALEFLHLVGKAVKRRIERTERARARRELMAVRNRRDDDGIVG